MEVSSVFRSIQEDYPSHEVEIRFGKVVDFGKRNNEVSEDTFNKVLATLGETVYEEYQVYRPKANIRVIVQPNLHPSVQEKVRVDESICRIGKDLYGASICVSKETWLNTPYTNYKLTNPTTITVQKKVYAGFVVECKIDKFLKDSVEKVCHRVEIELTSLEAFDERLFTRVFEKVSFIIIGKDMTNQINIWSTVATEGNEASTFVSSSKEITRLPNPVGTSSVPKDHYALLKYDGVRTFVLVNEQAIVATRINGEETVVACPSNFGSCALLEAEFYEGVYYVYDLVYYKKEIVHVVNFPIERRFTMINEIVKTLGCPLVVSKHKYPSSWEAIDVFLYQETPKVRIDGLIFTPRKGTYFGAQHLKWKPIPTVDVLVKDKAIVQSETLKGKTLDVPDGIWEITTTYQVLKERKDKVFPNSERVIKNTMNLGQQNPLEIGRAILESMDDRGKNNYLKWRCLKKLPPKVNVILDVGSGKGGDLLKYSHYTNVVFGIEPCKDFINDFNTRAKELVMNTSVVNISATSPWNNPKYPWMKFTPYVVCSFMAFGQIAKNKTEILKFFGNIKLVQPNFRYIIVFFDCDNLVDTNPIKEGNYEIKVIPPLNTCFRKHSSMISFNMSRSNTANNILEYPVSGTLLSKILTDANIPHSMEKFGTTGLSKYYTTIFNL